MTVTLNLGEFTLPADKVVSVTRSGEDYRVELTDTLSDAPEDQCESATKSEDSFSPDSSELHGEMADPPHVGGQIADAMKAEGMSIGDAAERLGVGAGNLSLVVGGDAPVTPKLAIALERLSWGEAKLWLQMQANYDLALARAKDAHYVDLTLTVDIESAEQLSFFVLGGSKWHWVPVHRHDMARKMSSGAQYSMTRLSMSAVVSDLDVTDVITLAREYRIRSSSIEERALSC